MYSSNRIQIGDVKNIMAVILNNDIPNIDNPGFVFKGSLFTFASVGLSSLLALSLLN